jgi:hypothetical protein
MFNEEPGLEFHVKFNVEAFRKAAKAFVNIAYGMSALQC